VLRSTFHYWNNCERLANFWKQTCTGRPLGGNWFTPGHRWSKMTDDFGGVIHHLLPCRRALSTCIAPCSTLKSDTPHKLWTKGSDPTGSHHSFGYKTLKALGCQAYTKIKKEHRDKLSPKADNLIMVGYNQMSKACKLLNPKFKKVLT
jgi:hypothetical protein